MADVSMMQIFGIKEIWSGLLGLVFLLGKHFNSTYKVFLQIQDLFLAS
jgi:hypothetical protein